MTFSKVVFMLIFLASKLEAQIPRIQILETGKKISIRGLSVVDDKIIWASGNNGSVARSIDGGKSWNWINVVGYTQRDFRDIEAFDENTALIMGVAEPAIILKTTDGGKSWQKVFEDSTIGMFLDAMDFRDDSNGVVIGDPIGKTVFMATTHNQGVSWQTTTQLGLFHNIPLAKEGEAFFASSGTNVKLVGNHPLYVSGGKQARIFFGTEARNIPILQGKESTGANSVAMYNPKKGMIVGGDFSKDTISTQNAVSFSITNRIRFTTPNRPPHGYRSCVIYLDAKNLLTCGTSGIDISHDSGNNWQLISKESFHVCQKAKKGTSVFLAGSNGRIAKLVY